MSIGSVFRHAAHKAKRKAEHVEHTAEHVSHEVEHAADKTKDAVEHAATKAKEGVEMLDPTKIADEVKKELTQAINELKDKALKAIESAQHEASKSIQDLAKKAKDELEADLKSIEKKLEGKTAQEVLGYLVGVIRTVSPSDVSIQLGPIALDIGNIEQKVEKIAKWAKNPPVGRKDWIQFVKDVEPHSLSLTASIGFAFIVESSDLELQVQATWQGSDILDNIEKILDKAGL